MWKSLKYIHVEAYIPCISGNPVKLNQLYIKGNLFEAQKNFNVRIMSTNILCFYENK